MERIFNPTALSAPEAEDGLAFTGLVERAKEASGDERRDRAEAISQALRRLPRLGGEVASRALHALLDDGALDDLAGALGVPCRVVAVEVLLGLGFPYALEVRPEDLEYYRRHQGDDDEAIGTLAMWVAAGIGVAGMMALSEWPAAVWTWVAVAAPLLLSFVAATALVGRVRRRRARRLAALGRPPRPGDSRAHDPAAAEPSSLDHR